MKNNMNCVVEAVKKYWPECYYDPLRFVIASPNSRLRHDLLSHMLMRGATAEEFNAVLKYYERMDDSAKICITDKAEDI